MSARKRRLTDDEIEADVLADLDNPAAWDEPIAVPPSNSPRPGWVVLGRHLELSARFHVLSVLHRLGAEASLTNTHPGNVDITVLQAPGRVLTIDVKTLIGSTSWFAEPVTARENHFVVFVLFPKNAPADPSCIPEVIVFPSTRLKTLLDKETTPPVDVRALAGQLGITDPWRQLIARAA